MLWWSSCDGPQALDARICRWWRSAACDGRLLALFRSNFSCRCSQQQCMLGFHLWVRGWFAIFCRPWGPDPFDSQTFCPACLPLVRPLPPNSLPLVSRSSPSCFPRVCQLSPTLSPTFLPLVTSCLLFSPCCPHLSCACLTYLPLPLVSHLFPAWLPVVSSLSPTCLCAACPPLVSRLFPTCFPLMCFWNLDPWLLLGCKTGLILVHPGLIMKASVGQGWSVFALNEVS